MPFGQTQVGDMVHSKNPYAYSAAVIWIGVRLQRRGDLDAFLGVLELPAAADLQEACTAALLKYEHPWSSASPAARPPRESCCIEPRNAKNAKLVRCIRPSDWPNSFNSHSVRVFCITESDNVAKSFLPFYHEF